MDGDEKVRVNAYLHRKCGTGKCGDNNVNPWRRNQYTESMQECVRDTMISQVIDDPNVHSGRNTVKGRKHSDSELQKIENGGGCSHETESKILAGSFTQ